MDKLQKLEKQYDNLYVCLSFGFLNSRPSHSTHSKNPTSLGNYGRSTGSSGVEDLLSAGEHGLQIWGRRFWTLFEVALAALLSDAYTWNNNNGTN